MGFKRRPFDWIKPLLDSAVDFVYPRACCICGAYDDFIKMHKDVCRDCDTDLIEPVSDLCVRCSAPVGPYVSTDQGCQHCRSVKLKFGPVVRLGIYRDLLRVACLRGKVSGGASLIHGLSRRLMTQRRDELTQCSPDVVLPVPQHWSQRFSRSFNPAETIARVIANGLNVNCATHILRKRRSTGTQKSLSVAERKQNVRDAYVVDYPVEVKGQSVMLVDDVMTTGITANEITSVLLKAGATRVSLAVVARVLQE